MIGDKTAMAEPVEPERVREDLAKRSAAEVVAPGEAEAGAKAKDVRTAAELSAKARFKDTADATEKADAVRLLQERHQAGEAQEAQLVVAGKRKGSEYGDRQDAC